ncbi:MFS transporter [Blastococcus tunisiensis]|uniref:Predicted arabinose efflux permease, MFS family n=1 Tax=Blastococcus tunisiensis TaxID=1798228 RepID=A0A1I2KMU8_9ACTN|nr:MFS transporter [Blastococcus sp. DSM 46838]SFF67570.1 Predicted arabinose efflux permease, MFS family [Blastococcus sp. DSM 46838]
MARRAAGQGTRSPAGTGPGRTSWGAVAGLMGAGVVAAAQIGGAAAALPVLQDDFGLSPSTAAWYLSTVSALGAAGGVLLGWLGQTLGFGRQVRLGLLAIVAADLGGAVVGSLTGLLVARVAEGLGLVMVILAAPPLLAEVSAPTHRRLVAGTWGAYMPVGSGLAALLVPSAIGLVGWRGASVVDAGLAALVLLVVLRRVPSPAGRGRPSIGGLLGALRSPSVVIITAVFCLYAGQYLAVVGLLPATLVAGDGLSVGAAGLVGAVVFLVNAPGNLLGAYLLHRGAPLRWLIPAGAAGMAATVWGVLDPALPLAVRVASALAFSFVSGLVPSALFAGLAAVSAGTGSAGAAIGLVTQGSAVGQLLGPPLVVAVGAAAGAGTAQSALLAGLAGLIAVGAVVLPRGERIR